MFDDELPKIFRGPSRGATWFRSKEGSIFHFTQGVVDAGFQIVRGAGFQFLENEDTDMVCLTEREGYERKSSSAVAFPNLYPFQGLCAMRELSIPRVSFTFNEQ